ncbi:MAG: cysteine dioxygenase family protein [Acidobacteriota bacterium]
MPLLQTRTSLAHARDVLLALPEPFTRDSVHQALACLRPSRRELEPYLNFSPDHYTRTLFYGGPRFEILILCWEKGQASPIHDHAASLCSMAVVSGCCVSESYRLLETNRVSHDVRPGEQTVLEPTIQQSYSEGDVVTVAGGDIHRISNPDGEDRALITAHFYLPPIRTMRCYDEETGCCRISRPETLSPRA